MTSYGHGPVITGFPCRSLLLLIYSCEVRGNHLTKASVDSLRIASKAPAKGKSQRGVFHNPLARVFGQPGQPIEL